MLSEQQNINRQMLGIQVAKREALDEITFKLVSSLRSTLFRFL